MATEQIDRARAEAFAARLMGLLNGASLTAMISIGHQTGLFDTMSQLPPSTCAEIARATGLNERYVREWLGAVVTGQIVEYNPTAKTYRLPPEHAAFLTRAAGPNNLAAFTQFFAMIGEVEQDVVASFRNGGGVPYERFRRFQQLMAEESAQFFDAKLISVTVPLVPGLVDRLRKGIDVADIGCGQGHAVNLMAKEFPNSRFVGYDFSADGIAAARREKQELGLTNVTFEVQDVAVLEKPESFDFITAFDAIHDQAHPRKVLRNIAKALRPEGVFLMVDIAADSEVQNNMAHPLAPMLYAISTMHCMTVSLALNGEGLGTMWGEQKARELLIEAGFNQIDVKRVEGDILNGYYVCRK